MKPIHTNNGTLKYDVMIEHSNGNGYTARLLAWPDTIVQASTREKVLQEMRMLLLDRLAKAEIVTLEIQPTEIDHSWAPFAGMWADIPDLEEFRAEIERNRRSRPDARKIGMCRVQQKVRLHVDDDAWHVEDG